MTEVAPSVRNSLDQITTPSTSSISVMMRDHLFAAGADEKLQAYQLVTGQVPKRSNAAADIGVDRNDVRDPLDAEAAGMTSAERYGQRHENSRSGHRQ